MELRHLRYFVAVAEAGKLLPLSAVSRPLLRQAPEIALAVGYNTTKVSPILEHLLSPIGRSGHVGNIKSIDGGSLRSFPKLLTLAERPPFRACQRAWATFRRERVGATKLDEEQVVQGSQATDGKGRSERSEWV